MSESLLCESCVPWEPEIGCCQEKWETYSPDLQCRATSLAWSTLHTLTAGRVGNCPVTIRPCVSEACDACVLNIGFSTPWWPVIIGGQWYNCGCGCPGCSCSPLSAVELPGRVARIESIYIDGNLVPAEAYSIDNRRIVVRRDGASWPSCQDMNAPAGAPGTFTITYTPGVEPGEDGLWAAGILACEYASACTGGKCRLPSTVTSIARNGVSMELSNNLFDQGLSGIREVDAYVKSLNPHGLRTASRVWSPDLASGKHTFI